VRVLRSGHEKFLQPPWILRHWQTEAEAAIKRTAARHCKIATATRCKACAVHSSFGAGLARRRTTCPCLRPWHEWMFERPSIQALSKHGVYCLIIIFSFNGNFWWMPYFLRKVNPLGIEDSYEMLCKMNENGELNSEIYLWNQVIFNSSVSLPGGKSIYHPIISHQISLFTSIKSAYCWYLPKFPPKMDGSPPSLHDFRATFRAGSR